MQNSNKILSLVLALLLLLSLVACGGSKGSEDKSKTDPTTGSTEAPTAGNNEPPKNETPTPGDPTEPAESLSVHENTFFTVAYNEAEGWTLAEDDIYTSEYGGYVYLRNLNEDGYTGLLVKIEANDESASSFRWDLHNNAVDMKAYVEGTWVSENIGGIQMAAVDKEYGEWHYFGRDEGAGVSYSITVSDIEDPRVAPVLESIQFTAPEDGNVDPPWPWEGEPSSGETLSQMVGTYTLTAQFLPIEDCLVTYETFDHDIVVMEDKVFLLSDGVLYQYFYDGSTLKLVKDISLPGEYTILEQGTGGKVILSNFMQPTFGHDGASAQFSCEGPDYLSMAPDGTWGISWFVSGEDCERYTFQNNVLTGSPFPFAEVDTIRQICIDNNYILISGSSVVDDEQYLFVYDHSGVLQMQLSGDPDGIGLGSVTYAVSTPNGFLALDGNMREVLLWSADGTWIGSVEDYDLFGTWYPWFAAADIAEDGSILIVMSEERLDESADEVLVFKLTGF